MTPGGNLLKRALRLISSQRVTYYKYGGRTTDEAGVYVPQYNLPIYLDGSLQSVPRNLYQNLGLDWNKNYKTFYCSTQLLDVQRGVTGDQFAYAGRQYQVESSNDWYAQDGWNGVLAVDIGSAPPFNTGTGTFGFNRQADQNFGNGNFNPEEA